MAKGWKFTPEQLKRLSDAHKGYVHPDEQKRKISESVKESWKGDEGRKELLVERMKEQHKKDKDNGVLNPFQKYVKEHPEHQKEAGIRGGYATIAKYGRGHIKPAYQKLTPELRLFHRRRHDKAVKEYANHLQSEGATIIFTDLKTRPDIIYFKDGLIKLIDVKTKKDTFRVEEEGEINISELLSPAA